MAKLIANSVKPSANQSSAEPDVTSTKLDLFLKQKKLFQVIWLVLPHNVRVTLACCKLHDAHRDVTAKHI